MQLRNKYITDEREYLFVDQNIKYYENGIFVFQLYLQDREISDPLIRIMCVKKKIIALLVFCFWNLKKDITFSKNIIKTITGEVKFKIYIFTAIFKISIINEYI